MVILSCLLLSVVAVGCSEDAGKDKAKEKDNKASTEVLKESGGDSTKEEQTEPETAPEPPETVEESYGLDMTTGEFVSKLERVLTELEKEDKTDSVTLDSVQDDGFFIYPYPNTAYVGNTNNEGEMHMITLLCFPAEEGEELDYCGIGAGVLLSVIFPEFDADNRYDMFFEKLEYETVKETHESKQVSYNDYILQLGWMEEGEGALKFSIMKTE